MKKIKVRLQKDFKFMMVCYNSHQSQSVAMQKKKKENIQFCIQKGNKACILGTKGINGKLEELTYPC